MKSAVWCHRTILPFLFTVLIPAVLSLSACGDGDSDVAQETVDPSVRGAFEVGQRVAELTYTPAGLNEERTLRVVVWYPTLETDGVEPLFKSGRVYIDATPAPDTKFPVAVFSHGTTVFADVGHPLTEHFASHGFVVVAPDHTDDTAANRDDLRQTEMYIKRPLDISAVLDWVYALESPDPLAGKLTDEVVLTGHSFGGFTAFAAAGAGFPAAVLDACAQTTESGLCSHMTDENRAAFETGFRDDRIDVLIPIAPGNAYDLGPEGVSSIQIPVLHMSASGDKRASNEVNGDPYWNRITSPDAIRVNFDTGGHHSFVITCEVFPALGAGDGCGDEFMDWEEAHHLMNTYALAFTRYHLFDDRSMASILDGTESLSEDITLSHK